MLAILGFITGLAGPISAAVAKIADLNIAKVQAESDIQKAGVDAQIAEAHDRMSVLVAEAGSRINAIIRGLIAFGPMTYLNKVFLFDKVLGSFLGHSVDGSMFTTDALDSNLWTVVTVCLSFYFVYDIAASWRKK